MSYLGIDPGINGAIAVLTENHDLQTYKMPETEADILALLRELQPAIRLAMLEHVQAIPTPGVSTSAMFNFGAHFGALRMGLLAVCIPFETVRPAVWQRSMGCLSGGKKNLTKSVAQQLFPTHKITHGNADAALIAEFLWRREIKREVAS
jgi:hypothetical protein